MSPTTTYCEQNSFSNGPNGLMARPAPSKLVLHAVDLTTWDDGDWADPIFSEMHPDELDEPWPYRFERGEIVWVCASDGKWYCGSIVGQAKEGRTRYDNGLFWCVEFYVARNRIRKWFAPLNGDIKPDTQNTHKLLSEAGWLESDSEGFSEDFSEDDDD